MEPLAFESSVTLKRRYRESACSVDDLASAIRAGKNEARTAHASAMVDEVPIYESRAIVARLGDVSARTAIQDEWIGVLSDGAGVFVLEGAYADTAVIDEATRVFDSILADEQRSGQGAGDHFAKPGTNGRLWNAQQKLCLRAPEVFARYFANPLIEAAAEAWLGPAFQTTSQVNVVRPGGAAQEAHRDYHLGFQSVDAAQAYPAHVHAFSPYLTLQGAIAHSDMPVETGPTKLLPYSQRYAEGYVAWRRSDFRDFFEAHCIQLPLQKGDALFFSPALFHAAGANRTADVHRMANLLQISSPYGRAMEAVDRTAMCEALFPVLKRHLATGAMSEAQAHSAIASCAEGYPFPTNLDRDKPIGGLAPESQQALFWRALEQAWDADRFAALLREQDARRKP